MKKIIYTEKAPKPIGPYSQAIEFNNLIFTSGQIAMDKEGNLVDGGIKEQTKIILENIKNILEAAGSSINNCLKTTVYLKDMNDFADMNEIYLSYFLESSPSRTTVEVNKLPKDAKICIDVIAYSSISYSNLDIV